MTPTSSRPLPQLLLARADAQADAIAYRILGNGEEETETISFGHLALRVQRTAARLAAAGVRPGDRVLLLFPSGLDFVASFLGCLHAGAIAVPSNAPRNSRRDPRLLAILKDCGARVALTSEDLLETVRSRLSESGPGVAPACLTVGDLFEDPMPVPVERSGEDLALLQYTSGSTGHPKGVMVRHRNLLDNLEFIRTAFELGPHSRCLTWLPSFHDMGLVDGILQPLHLGVCGVVMPPAAFLQRPARWLQAVSRYQITHSGGPDFGYLLCAHRITEDQLNSVDLSSWISAYSGAEPVRPTTLDAFCERFGRLGFRRAAFYPCYGLAEDTLMVSGGSVADEPRIASFDGANLQRQGKAVPASPASSGATTLVSVGRPRLDTQVVIAHPETQAPLPDGLCGEILVSGNSVAAGYWENPEDTRTTFEARLPGGEGPFLRTGDLGFLHDGDLFIAGRIKDLIIIRGENHFPQDLELTVEEAHPAIRRGCVAAFTVEQESGERLVIAAELERTALRDLDGEAVAAAIREAVSLEHDLLAQSIVLLRTGTIPKTSSGKIQRRACRNDFLEGSLVEVARSEVTADDTSLDPVAASPGSDDSDVDIAVWLGRQLAHHLGLPADAIDPDTPFAQYGLDSSVALGLTGELGDLLGTELSPTLLWDYPTISEVVGHLETSEPA